VPAVPVDPVDDPADPRLADYVGLTDVARRTRVEPGRGIFLAEGELVIRRALAAGYPPRSLLLSPRWAAALGAHLRAVDVPVYVATEDVLERVTGFHVHRGALGSFDRRPVPAAGSVLARARRVLVCEGIVNHTNLGLVFRSAAALGMDAVLLDPGSCDPLYRRSVRVSMGAVLTLPYARLPAGPAGLAAVRAAGFELVALTPRPAAEPIEVLAGRPARRALLLGTEGRGLSDAALAAADRWVRIPMAPGVDSLNVGIAAAIACYVLGRGQAGEEDPDARGDDVPLR
jgi:tRNA G18 (ribose-2'-O)-methylase SpoU